LEADMMFRIVLVVEKIAKENNIPLNTNTVRLWVGKLSRYVALIAGPNAKKLIDDEREKLMKDNTTVNTKAIIPNSAPPSTSVLGKVKDKLTGWATFFNRVLAPGEYLRILIREVVILHIFFSIMMAEFDLFMRAAGEAANKEWTKSPEFILFLKANRGNDLKVATEFANRYTHISPQELTRQTPISPATLDAAASLANQNVVVAENIVDSNETQEKLQIPVREAEEKISSVLDENATPMDGNASVSHATTDTAAAAILNKELNGAEGTVEGNTGGTPVNTGRTSGGGRRTHRKHLRRRR
jgi:hypothetical protein